MNPTPATNTIDLDIAGMTCASCVARVERRLATVPGVSATVNLATQSAHVTSSAPLTQARVAELVAAVAAAGYSAHLPVATTPDPHTSPAPKLTTTLRPRLLTAIVLTVPVAALSMVGPLQFPGWQWVVAAATLPVVTWCAWPFHLAAARAARHATSTMDTLVSLGVIAATTWSVWALAAGGAGTIGLKMHVSLLAARPAPGTAPELYFEVAAVVTTFLLAGRYLEQRARARAGNALQALLGLGAKDVLIRRAGTAVRLPIAALAVGDEFEVRPGEKVATDGVVIEGTCALDTSLLTGESVPVDVSVGDEVTGATLNTTGHLVVRATKVGADTVLAAIGRLVTAAQTSKAPIQRLADRISAVFVPIVLVMALATALTWLSLGYGAQPALTAAVAVLIIACPCALGLATPTALLAGTGRGSELGIVIKGLDVLESTRRIDTVVLDKTGTLTSGRMQVVEVATFGAPRAQVLHLAGAVEARSEHPIAAAIAAHARAELGLADAVAGPGGVAADGSPVLAEASSFQAAAGGGASAVVRVPHAGVGLGQRVLVGNLPWIRSQGLHVRDEVADRWDQALAAGATAVAVAWDGTVRAIIVLRDEPKPGASQAIAELRAMGLTPVLLTGDNQGAARAVATRLGIEQVIAEVLPAGKVAAVNRLRAGGAVVAMVGDGVNDAAALASADLGMAMGSGTDVAIEAADITLMRADVASVGQAIRLARATLRLIKQNLFWAFAYNVIALPLAALGLLNPMIAGAAMAASSVLVVTNSLRLTRFAR